MPRFKKENEDGLFSLPEFLPESEPISQTENERTPRTVRSRRRISPRFGVDGVAIAPPVGSGRLKRLPPGSGIRGNRAK